MDEPRSNRAARLALIPEEERKLCEERLQMWDLLPPALQQEWEDKETIVNYFAQIGSATGKDRDAILRQIMTQIPHGRRVELEKGLDSWGQMSEAERRQAMAGFNRFFELTPEEKEKTLNTASDEERQQMEQALNAYGKLTPSQRAQCIDSFKKFATMSIAEREQFLRNAERWREMTPEERQKWRDLVNVAPIMPPIGNPKVRSIPPPRSSGPAAPAVATN
jgi:hypothetical protein